MATQYANGKIVTNGLILCLDAADRNSYPGSGTTWYDVSGNNYHFTLNGSYSFTTNNGASCFSFPGDYSNQTYASRAGAISHDVGTQCTIQITYSSIGGATYNGCSRLFSMSDGSSANNDYSTYFTLASCDSYKHGLWYQNSPGGLYPTTNTVTATDSWFTVTYSWTSGTSAKVYTNSVLENSTNSVASAFNYANVGRMTVCMNSALGGGTYQEHTNAKVSKVIMYNRQLSDAEVKQNYNAQKSRFNL
jgi:hypothetical protein